jgi:hypothetical protein
VGVLLVILQIYVYAAWLADGPHQITQFRDHDDASWVMARVYESIVVLGFVACVWHAVRTSRRIGRLSFDAKLVLASLSIIWLDGWTDLVAPIWLYSSQWLNLNLPFGYIPGAINPGLKQIPFPLFHFFNYTVALLGAGILVSTAMRRIKARWPRLSNAQLIMIIAVLGMAFDLAYEFPMFRLRLWAYPGTPDWLALFPGTSMKFPIFEIIPAGIAFAAFGALRFFVDDRGEHLTERGLAGSQRRRTLVSVLALCGLLQLLWIGCTSVQVIGGFYAAPYKALPPHLVNDLCDAPLLGGGRLVGTRYGPCPQEGGQYPIRGFPERNVDAPGAKEPCVVGREPSAPPVPWPACTPDDG